MGIQGGKRGLSITQFTKIMEESSQIEPNALDCCGKVSNKQIQNEFFSYYKYINIDKINS